MTRQQSTQQPTQCVRSVSKRSHQKSSNKSVGKIAAKQREQVLAITAQLEARHAIEKADVEARAKADLEAERQGSVTREALIWEEARQAAGNDLKEKLAEAERIRHESLAAMQLKVSEAESARKSAEQLEATLRAEVAEIRGSSAAEIKRLKADATHREGEIREEAQRSAELAADKRVAALETAHKEAEAALHARISDADENRAAAEQNETALKLQVEELRKDKEAEIARLKEGVEKDAERIRQDAVERTEVRLRDEMATHEKAVAEAGAKARDAERHAAEVEERLATQREIMEKAKDDAVNAEKAKAFQENQKHLNKVGELQRALEKKTADELGEGAEIDLFEALNAEFRDDNIQRIAKGTPGADICHVVMLGKTECGTILYDSKNRKRFEAEYVTKLRGDQLAAKAEHAILSTTSSQRGASRSTTRTVWCSPIRLVSSLLPPYAPTRDSGSRATAKLLRTRPKDLPPFTSFHHFRTMHSAFGSHR